MPEVFKIGFFLGQLQWLIKPFTNTIWRKITSFIFHLLHFSTPRLRQLLTFKWTEPIGRTQQKKTILPWKRWEETFDLISRLKPIVPKSSDRNSNRNLSGAGWKSSSCFRKRIFSSHKLQPSVPNQTCASDPGDKCLALSCSNYVYLSNSRKPRSSRNDLSRSRSLTYGSKWCKPNVFRNYGEYCHEARPSIKYYHCSSSAHSN